MKMFDEMFGKSGKNEGKREGKRDGKRGEIHGKTSYPKRLKLQRERGPIPYVVSMELAFLPEDLREGQYEEEVRRIVREKMPEILEERRIRLAWERQPKDEVDYLFEEYDEQVSEI